MSNSKNESNSGGCGCFINGIPATLTAMVGYHIHGSIFFAICDWILWPVAILKWLIFHQVTLSIIKETFAWFLR